MIKKYCIIAFLALGAILLIFPKIDIYFTQIFYHEYLDFIYRDDPLVIATFRSVPIVTIIAGGLMFVSLCYNAFRKKKILSSPAFYMLLALLIGPGLLVNYVFKEHFGRARPKHILEFGGDKAFTPPLYISDQCTENCSFASGHASMGYYVSALSYVVPSQYKTIAFLSGIALGSSIGFGRVLQGGHFFSDVVFSGLFIMLTNHLCFLLWQKLSGRKVGKERARLKPKLSKKGGKR